MMKVETVPTTKSCCGAERMGQPVKVNQSVNEDCNNRDNHADGAVNRDVIMFSPTGMQLLA
jgi:hypothetical protein